MPVSSNPAAHPKPTLIREIDDREDPTTDVEKVGVLEHVAEAGSFGLGALALGRRREAAHFERVRLAIVFVAPHLSPLFGRQQPAVDLDDEVTNAQLAAVSWPALADSNDSWALLLII